MTAGAQPGRRPLGDSEPVVATYRFVGQLDEVRAAAQAFAMGQSVGTWVPLPGLTEELLTRHGARVVSATSEPGGTVAVEMAFPTGNFEEGGLPMLLTTLLGNDPSTGISAALVDIVLPVDYALRFPGSRLGIVGWRERLGVHGRPLLLNPMKPCTGLPPEATAAIAADVARGGIDLVKDDEVLADASFSHIADRCDAVRRALDAVAAETGHRARYVVSITDRGQRMREHARAALEHGADGVMVAPFMAGLDALQQIVEDLDGALPVIAHTAGLDMFGAGQGLAVAPEVLVARCLRLAGADAVLIGSPWARRATAQALWESMARRLRDGWASLAPVFPVVGGGVVAEQLNEIVRLLGVDVIITAGGAVNGHPDGATAGARAMRLALEQAVAGSTAGTVGSPAKVGT